MQRSGDDPEGVRDRGRRVGGWRVADDVLGGDRPVVMGVLNVTPDSFSDGGLALGEDGSPDVAVARGLALVAAGADIVDVGGESTRPGAAPVSGAREIDRTEQVVAGLAAAGVRVSIDTTKASVAAAAIDAGAVIVNDVSAGRFDPDLLPLVADRGVAYVLMHMVGTPRTMQDEPAYDDVVAEVAEFLATTRDRLVDDGIADDRIAIDPGIGFGKSMRHNLDLLRATTTLAAIAPVVIGVSRKSFLGTITGMDDPADRDPASAAVAALVVAAGALIVRAHDVVATRQAVDVARVLAGDGD
ncbi:MAG TPA: dihydropteroate synthase [Nitriliruptoraceae bacterium]|nr:dihydropteroate synthase [Nitriliruptoraceae bacterium]